MIGLHAGLEVTASAEVAPGPLRWRVAQAYKISAQEVTAEHVARYLTDQEERP